MIKLNFSGFFKNLRFKKDNFIKFLGGWNLMVYKFWLGRGILGNYCIKKDVFKKD